MSRRGKQRGGLRLDSRKSMLDGGDSGAAIEPGKPDESTLISAIRYTDKDLRMPPKSAGGKLSDEKIATLTAWVKIGRAVARVRRAGPRARSSKGTRSPRRIARSGRSSR